MSPHVVIALCCMLPAGATAPKGTQTRAADRPQSGSATIRGRVVAADSGRPLRHAQMRLSATDTDLRRTATTDTEGRYEFAELPAGRYTVSTKKGGYVGLSYGERRAFESGTPLEVREGQRFERVDFALPRGGVVAGRLVDEFGDPVPDGQVALLRYLNVNGHRLLIPLGGQPGSSNDLGEFRLFGVLPGQYYLRATARPPTGLPADLENPPGYAPTFFPGTTDARSAQKLAVRVGETISDVIVPLMPARLARVTGTAVDSAGRPLSGAVRILPRDLSSFVEPGGPSGSIGPDGRFVIDDIVPGTYRLVGNKLLSATGRVRLDHATEQSLSPSTLQVFATSADIIDELWSGSFTPPSNVKDDFTFELKARPGQYRVLVSGLPEGSAIRAVRYRGVDVTDSGIEFSAKADLSDIEIDVTSRTSTLTGIVVNGRSERVNEYTVLVYPQDRNRWTFFESRYIQDARPDQDGRFKITGLPPGDYCAIALESIDAFDILDPEYLDQIRAKTTPFSISDGETKTLDLTLSPAS